MTETLFTISSILEENYLLKSANIDTYEVGAIMEVEIFLKANKIPYTYNVSYRDGIAAFAWVEDDTPQLLLFKFKKP